MSQLLHIRSKDGTNFQSGSSGAVKTGFTINLDSPIKCEQNQTLYLSLASFAFPHSFYTTDSTNNELVVVVEYEWLGTRYLAKSYSLKKGNHDVFTFRDELLAKLNQTSLLGGFTDFNNTNNTNKFLIVYDEVTNQYNFAFHWDNTGGGVATRPKIHFLWASNVDGNAPPAAGCFKQLGHSGNANFQFTAPQLATAAPSYPTEYFSGDAVVNMHRTDDLYVRTSLSTNSVSSRSKSSSTILQKIPINQPPNNYIYFYASQTKSRVLLGNKTISSVTIQITDDEGVLIDSNEVDFTLSLQFDVEYTPPMLVASSERRLFSRKPKVWKHLGESHIDMINSRLK
jgi:hypothetical protein